ncbi:MAG TPA: hypothetical protein DCL48_08295 [Alphaproteobacteria bacterium]|nr:hypothetical protein [Alphaproteobacteria bacterium]
MTIGGQTVTMNNVNGLAGGAADGAYVAVASGEAVLGSLTAVAGEAILIPPYGRAPSIVTFDAGRARVLLGDSRDPAVQAVASDLADVAEGQEWGLFFGRYRRTLLDLQSPGGQRTEAGRASVMGAPEVVRIRYSGVSDPGQIEEMVVERAAGALASGDVAVFAQLLDPAPYGGEDLNGGGQDARLLVARQVISSFGGAATSQVQRGAEPGVWRAGRVTLRTRPFSDFIFISSVE